MATVNTNQDLTMLEIAKRTSPGGEIVDVVQTLSERNDFLQYAPWVEANGNDSHTFSQQLTQPSGTWSGVNEYVAAETGRSKQVTEPTRILKSYADIDLEILRRTRDKAKLRRQVANESLNGLTKEFARAFFYGPYSTSGTYDIDMIEGLAYRDEYDAAADTQVLDAGGSGSDTMSMWMVKFNYPNGLYFFYPPGGVNTMIVTEDKGEEPKYDSNGNIKYVMREEIRLNVGLAIGDPRNVVRIASIETTGSTTIFDFDDVVDAAALLADPSDMSGVCLMTNRTGWAQIWKDVDSRANVNYSPNAPYGTPVRTIADIPVVLMDSLLITETAL